jgi:hypothetical protein
MEAPLLNIEWKFSEFGTMSERNCLGGFGLEGPEDGAHEHDRHPPVAVDDERLMLQQPTDAAAATATNAVRHTSRVRSQQNQQDTASTNSSVLNTNEMSTHRSTPFDQRDEYRSAFTPVSQTTNQDQPRNEESGGIISPLPHRMPSPSAASQVQSPRQNIEDDTPDPFPYYNPYSHPQFHPGYGYSSYYPRSSDGNIIHNQSWQNQQGYPPHSYYQQHPGEYNPYEQVYSQPYSYPSSSSTHAHHSRHHQQEPPLPPPYRRTPPNMDSATKQVKETPSAVTEGTTPASSVARRGIEGMELSPFQHGPSDVAAAHATDAEEGVAVSVHNAMQMHYSMANLFDSSDEDRKPSAVAVKSSEYFHDRKPVAQDPNDFEPIPLNQMNLPPLVASSEVAAAASCASQETSHLVHVAPPANEISTPSSRRQRPPPQYRAARASSSMSGTSTTSGGEGTSWEKRFNELLEFKARQGHCDVPQNYPENASLGIWVNKQRMEHKNRSEGKNSSLNDVRLRRLQDAGFKWAKRKGQASWDTKFNELLAYRAEHGNCHVPTKYRENTALGRWVSTQRAEYKKYSEGDAKTSMNDEKVRRLESIGFAWFMAL